MKAVLCTGYGPPEVLQLAAVARPVLRKRELLVRVHATAVTASDCAIRRFRPGVWPPMRLVASVVLGFSKPRNPMVGAIIAGEVVAVGKRVSRFAEHDQIFGWASFPRLGAYAEYCSVSEKGRIARKPATATYEQAAALLYGLIALYFLRKARLESGQRVRSTR